MSNRILFSLAFIFAFTASALVFQSTHSQFISPQDQCRNRLHHELRQVTDEYRANIFGSTPHLGGSGFSPRTGGDTDEEVQGILATSGRLTSELVTPLVESYRVLRCRMEAVCSAMNFSFQEVGGRIDIQSLGCPEYSMPRYSECYFIGDSVDDKVTSSTTANMIEECAGLVAETLETERAVLRLAVGYDAGFRASLQFAGMTDWMMQGLPDTALETTRNTINILGKIHQIPCFIGQCDMPDTSTITP